VRKVIILFVFLWCGQALFASILNVPQDYSTIQSGIDASVENDTVLVQPGTYTENINYNGKNIVVASLFLLTQDSTYISETIIDGGQNGSVVTFENFENTPAQLIGFTLTNGSGTYSDPPGSGIYYYWGGGIYLCYSKPTIKKVLISDNSADYGAGMLIFDAKPIIRNITIANNYANNSGGGISCGWDSYPWLEDIIITDNFAEAGGGIHFAYEANPDINNITISNNSTNSHGGAISCFYSSPILKEMNIYNNTSHRGAGINLAYSNSVIKDLAIVYNTSDGLAGGIAMSHSNPVLSNVTIANNLAFYWGRGIYCRASNPVLINTILWNFQSPEIFFYQYDFPNSVTIAYSDIRGDSAGIMTNDNGVVNWLEGNIDYDPLFQNPADLDFSLQASSPCIDAGTSFFTWQGDTLVNIPDSSYFGTAPDMGAYEWQGYGIDHDFPNLPCKFSLYQNNPNPFYHSTAINYYIPKSCNVEIRIYNIKGQLKETLVDEQKNKGNYSVDFNAEGLNSGIYFYSMEVANMRIIKKMILLQ